MTPMYLAFIWIGGGVVVGCYLIPDYALTTDRVVAAISQFPHGDALMVAGDFNNDLAEPEVHPCDK